MVKFKIDEIEYQIGDYLTIDQYAKIFNIKDLFTDEYFAAKLINIICGTPLQTLLESEYNSIQYLASYILSLLPTQNTEFVDRFEIDGVQYGFFPNWKDLTFAEFADMDTIATKKAEELLPMLHMLAAIMYRPIVSEKSRHDFKIEDYNYDKMMERANLFKNKLDVKYVISAQFFFIKYAKTYSNYFQVSSIKNLSIWKQIKLIWTMSRMIYRHPSKRTSDGSLYSIELLKTILQSTEPSLKKR